VQTTLILKYGTLRPVPTGMFRKRTATHNVISRSGVLWIFHFFFSVSASIIATIRRRTRVSAIFRNAAFSCLPSLVERN